MKLLRFIQGDLNQSYINLQFQRKRKNSSKSIQNGKIQKTDGNQGAGNIDESMEDEMIQTGMLTQEQEDIEDELKTSGSFNMKKFREKLKTNDFITGKLSVVKFHCCC